MKNSKFISKVSENPVLVLFLGACPAMAAGANTCAALTMGVMTLILLLVVSLIATLTKKIVSEEFRIPVFVVISVVLCSVMRMLINAFFPESFSALGVYTLVLSVSLLVYCNAEYAAENSFGSAIKNSLDAGLVFIIYALIVAIVREFFGQGSICGNEIAFMQNFKNSVFTQPSGGFLVLAFVAALVNRNHIVSSKKAAENAEIDSAEKE